MEAWVTQPAEPRLHPTPCACVWHRLGNPLPEGLWLRASSKSLIMQEDLEALGGPVGGLQLGVRHLARQDGKVWTLWLLPRDTLQDRGACCLPRPRPMDPVELPSVRTRGGRLPAGPGVSALVTQLQSTPKSTPRKLHLQASISQGLPEPAHRGVAR